MNALWEEVTTFLASDVKKNSRTQGKKQIDNQFKSEKRNLGAKSVLARGEILQNFSYFHVAFVTVKLRCGKKDAIAISMAKK